MPAPLKTTTVRRIRKLAASGLSRQQIAHRVGCSLHTVDKYLRGELRRVDVDLIKHRLRSGHRPADIAADAGCSVRQVERYKHSLGLTRTPDFMLHPLTPEKRAEIEEALAEGESWKSISARLHVSHHTLAKYYPGTGWSPRQTGEYVALVNRLRRIPAPSAHSSRRLAA